MNHAFECLFFIDSTYPIQYSNRTAHIKQIGSIVMQRMLQSNVHHCKILACLAGYQNMMTYIFHKALKSHKIIREGKEVER